MKKLFVIFLMVFPATCFADFSFKVSNSLFGATGPQGESQIPKIDPFNPSAHCSAFVIPNTCSVSGGSIHWTFVFNYSLTNMPTGSLDVSFSLNNGAGNQGEFQETTLPSNLIGLTNGSSGTFVYSVSFPVFSENINFASDISLNFNYNP